MAELAAAQQLIQTIFDLAKRKHFLDSDSITQGSYYDDQTRNDRLNAGRKDALTEIGGHAAELMDVTKLAWETLVQYTNLWTPAIQMKVERALRVLEKLAWTLHSRVRGILPTDLERFRSIVVAGSWVTCMSTFLLCPSFQSNIQEPEHRFRRLPLSMLTHVSDCAFVNALAAANQVSLIRQRDTINKMSVMDWKFTLESVWEAMCRYGWTPSGADLIEALAMRYALWLVYDPADSENDPTMFDHWTYCRIEDRTFPQLHPRLSDSFIFHAEKTVFFALRHSRAARAFVNHPRSRLLDESAQRVPMIRALVKFIKQFVQDAFLMSDVLEKVGILLSRRQLMPGEADRTFFESGSVVAQEIEGDDVLWDSRRAEVMRLQQDIIPLSTHEHVTQWADALLPVADREGWEEVAALRPIQERTAFLVLECALDQVWKKQQVPDTTFSFMKFAHVDDAGLPQDTPPESPEGWCRSVVHKIGKQTKGTPLFVAMAHMYAVVVPQPGDAREVQEVWITPYLPDALLCWLKQALARKRIRVEDIPEDLRPLCVPAQ